MNKCYFITYQRIHDSFGVPTNKIRLIKDSPFDILCKQFIVSEKSITYPITEYNNQIEITVEEGESSNNILFIMDECGKIFCHFDVQLPFKIDFYISVNDIKEKREKNLKNFSCSKYYPRYKENLNIINAVQRIKKHPNSKQLKVIEQFKNLKLK